ncbi:DUF1254 domain-containing protein [Cupriavidus basilensis]|uniref:DUF1254 domain-containing protein n=1 Tax=Cupriavidus basilensis TaxID=68895 RepID=UPI0023E896DD|nr:DUF1254 domain-containing protein [Cupriavidus basilensis]MDF3881838.1 DUF1254 domain-containing protein [Cupriavidus basilensis]
MNRAKRKTDALIGVLAIMCGVIAAIDLVPQATAQTLSAEALHQRTIERRAVELAIWGIPAVNYDAVYQAMVRANGHTNQIAYWSRPSNWKSQLLTPNSEVLYVIPFINTKDVGPIVLEIPPADDGVINGSVVDCWQTALEDVGPAGVDKGKGGKYLILPPGYKDTVPDGYIALPSQTFQSSALLRSIPKSHDAADLAAANAYLKRIRLYPLSEASNPPPTRFIDVADTLFDGTIPYDLRFFQSLDRMVQTEPVQTKDKLMYGWLASIGIEKGKPFKPDPSTKRILQSAITEAHAWLENRYLTVPPPYYPGKQWFFPAEKEVAPSHGTYELPDRYLTDARGTIYHWGFSSIKHAGTGQYYLMTTKDKEARFLNGSDHYRLTVPAKAPVTQYWSVTVYDRTTHAFIREMKVPNRSSLEPGLQKNTDGSVDIFFGPNAPAGHEANWIPTKRDAEFEVILRAYGPEKPLFDKTWQLPDIVKLQ